MGAGQAIDLFPEVLEVEVEVAGSLTEVGPTEQCKREDYQ
jgi:hypothetical protein